ncbi:MAG: TIGR00270 family protein [Thermofilum sp. ex4484_82]|nr:MAG: TIGR00270 family protein [Thermofilum sp. ex4484_82]OYT39971.1 MAG: TIGR00270 family protein [Archaeoglobales archaeon ex4484_92]
MVIMKCEICGADIRAKGYKVYIDRAELIVCEKCAKRYGTPIKEISAKPLLPSKTISYRTPLPRKRESKFMLREMKYSIVEDYAELIKNARIRQGLTRSLLASMVGEKESTIRRIEDGLLEPTLDLARRLERILKISLITEETDYNMLENTPEERYDLTLGDVVVFKKRKEEKP